MTFVPRSGITLALFLAVALSASAAREPHTDQFDRPPLDRSWTFFAPGGGSYEVRHGWLHLAAPGPLWMLGDEDSMPPMLLFEPPADDVFAATQVPQSRALHVSGSGRDTEGSDVAHGLDMCARPALGPGVAIVAGWRSPWRRRQRAGRGTRRYMAPPGDTG